MATEATSPQDLEFQRFEAEAKAENDKRAKAKGTRVQVGKTRGKGSINIKWEAFDEAIPESLPVTIEEFMNLTGKKDEPSLVSYLIEGYNQELYKAASDPLAEFVDPTWPDDAKTQFRLVVRNYSRGAMVSLEDAVSLIKPGFEKQFKK